MATTAQDIFDAAMGLMSEVDDTSGRTDTQDTKEYKQRTLLILNTLRGEFMTITNGERTMPKRITDFTSKVGLDDFVCQTILPYGLAAHLLLDENANVASFFQQRYDELKRQYGSVRVDGSTDITDVYGGIEYKEFGWW